MRSLRRYPAWWLPWQSRLGWSVCRDSYGGYAQPCGYASRVSPDRKYGQYAVFWPLAKDEMDSEPEDVEFSQNRIDRRWISAKLSVKSGRLTRTETVAGPDEIGGWIYEIGGSEAYNQHALPAKCPRCDADYRRRNLDTPLRLHRTGFQKACQVVAGALAREMPLERGDKPGRKLLIFTDSRQDAAKLASGMEQDHYRDMVRILLLKALDEYWGALEAALRVLSAAIPHTPDQNLLAESHTRTGYIEYSGTERPGIGLTIPILTRWPLSRADELAPEYGKRQSCSAYNSSTHD